MAEQDPLSPVVGMRLVNLRTFSDTGEIDLRQINFVFGKNSSGKTTLLRAPLLFRQFVEAAQHLHGTIDNVLAGPYVDFGSYADAVHNSQVSRDIGMMFELNLRKSLRGLPFRDRDEGELFKAFETIRLEVKLHWNKTRGHLQFSSISGVNASGELAFGFRRLGPQQIKVDVPSLEVNRTFSEMGELSFDSARQVFLRSYDRRVPSMLFVYLVEVLSETLSLVQHVGPLRDMPERAYRSDQLTLPGGSTRNTLGMLFNDPQSLRLVNDSVRKLGLAGGVELTTPAPGYSGIAIKDIFSGRHDNLADVGFGLSQALPILATVASALPGSLVLVEQPELHLHPETQGSLVDVLTDLAKRKRVALLIETHSENMLLRLRRKVASKQVSADEVRVLVTADREVREAKVATDGSIDLGVFPPDFFEEDWLDTLAIARASRSKS